MINCVNVRETNLFTRASLSLQQQINIDQKSHHRLSIPTVSGNKKNKNRIV